ncbi:MAG: reprolysin-like metallopeptidase [Taibaiella sp.]|jgi:hypothetical protein
MIRNKHHVLWIVLLLAFAGNVHAADFFKPFKGRQAPSLGKQVLIPDQYRVVSAGQELIVFLSGLPDQRAKAETIALPLPDGTSMDFYIWKTSMMEEPLQSKYQEIQTFTAVAKDNKNVTAKIDFTVKGFHAMVFDGSNTFMIDPYSDIADGYYSVYYKRDYKRPESQIMTCDIGDEQRIKDASGNLPEHIHGENPGTALKQYGSTKKTFRLALSCTYQYAAAVGGSTPTTASVLSAMTTSMNRVNGIYERELGVTMVLIGNNDLLIYLNSTTDPFSTNSDGGVLLGENQSNTDLVIGNANYDIGHIFSTGAGGIAFLSCVCSSSLKAGGVTGAANPVGDPYDVDYVAHEMGHQFSSEHTFNANTGACNDNAEFTTAYEPGSGSTIMAYAGICGSTNNLQMNSDAYFHAISLDQISNFLENEATCATNVAGGAPAVTLPSINSADTIPYLTPFELMAPVAVATSSDTMTYCWEQWNRGDFEQSENGGANFTFGPSFRSFRPKSTRLRVFPRIDSLVRNTTAYRGERLPAVARTLTFKLTARNIFNGMGAFNLSDDSVVLTVINTGQPFKVTSPDLATETLYGGSSHQITWNVAQTNIAPINTPNVDIFLSLDGGYTYPLTLATGVPNTGSYSATMPDTASLTARVKVKGAGNVFFDISNANFKLLDTTNVPNSIADVELNNDLSVYPNPAGNQITLSNKGQSSLTVQLYTTLGQRVWEGKMQKKLVIPVVAYARGIYYLRLQDVQKGSKAVKRISLQ